MSASPDGENQGVSESAIERLADEIWMLREELGAFARVANGQHPGKTIESAVPAWWMRRHLARYDFALPHLKNRRVLDMACGTGYGSFHLATKGAALAVLGAEKDENTIRYARLRYHATNLQFTVADACAAWTNERFDAITSFETIEHVAAPDEMLRRMTEVLAPAGVAFISTPVRRKGRLTDRPANPQHVREWSLEEFRELLSHFFETVDMHGQDWPIRRSIGSIRIPGAVQRGLMRLGGWREKDREAAEFDVHDVRTYGGFWLDRRPRVQIAVCRGAKCPGDWERVQRLAYGG